MSNQELILGVCEHIDCGAELTGFDLRKQKRFCHKCMNRFNQGRKSLIWKCRICEAVMTEPEYHHKKNFFCKKCKPKRYQASKNRKFMELIKERRKEGLSWNCLKGSHTRCRGKRYIGRLRTDKNFETPNCKCDCHSCETVQSPDRQQDNDSKISKSDTKLLRSTKDNRMVTEEAQIRDEVSETNLLDEVLAEAKQESQNKEKEKQKK